MTEQLRYADGPTAEVSRTIAASPAALWEYVSDINLPAKFSSEFQGAEWLDGSTEPAVGARFRGTNRHKVVGEWRAECTITAYEPERTIAWEVEGPEGPAAQWRFTLEPVASGDDDATPAATVVTQWCQIGPAASGLTPAIQKWPEREHEIVARRLDEHATNMRANLDGLAVLVGDT